MAPPQVRYARSGDVNVAFQAIGDGELDLVLILGALTNLNVFWDEPAYRRFVEQLGGFGGGIDALARQGTAAYLNANRPGMNYPYTSAQVVSMVQSAIQSGNATTIENTKNLLEAANTLEGPLC